MRSDALGIFWQDLPAVKKPKVEKVKRLPPEPFWLEPDYLPNLDEALNFFETAPIFTDMELYMARGKTRLVFDIECYPNYFCCAFLCIETFKVIVIEMDENSSLNKEKLQWILENFTIVTFNGIGYDQPIVSLALIGANTHTLFHATEQIIVYEEQPYKVLKSYKCKQLDFDHIDLIEVAPLKASLKKYAGRLHCQRMQDLPFPPGTYLSPAQRAITRWYCVNDLTNTRLLYFALIKQVKLRETMSAEYGVDVRSKSDAQVAEAVISADIKKITGQKRLPKPTVEPGRAYSYNVPNFIRYQTPLMQYVLGTIASTPFVVGLDGSIELPQNIADLKIAMGNSTYQMGIGGLHSTEKKAVHHADDKFLIRDYDVESFYPRIILNLGLYPEHLGPVFLQVYGAIVDRRVHAKRTGDKVTADSLKITINGSFGKLGSQYSVLYAPQLLIQTTVTGQLSLLMLIETLELNGISVVSANTDGIVIKCPRSREADMEAIVKWWEQVTKYKTEATDYKLIASRDVNNYIAVKPNGKVKTKGSYAIFEEGEVEWLKKNPTGTIITDAIIEYLTKGTPLDTTIRSCNDFTKFIVVRSVTKGAVKDREYLGTAIRWYHSTETSSEIVNAENGYKVPQSEGARPIMVMPSGLPCDIDYNYYTKRAERALAKLGWQ